MKPVSSACSSPMSQPLGSGGNRDDYEIQRAAAAEYHRERAERLRRGDLLAGTTRGFSVHDRTRALVMCLGEARRYQLDRKSRSATNSPSTSLPTSPTSERGEDPDVEGLPRGWFDVTPPKTFLEVRKDICLLMQQAVGDEGEGGAGSPTAPGSPKRGKQRDSVEAGAKDQFNHTMQELARLRMWNCAL